MSVELLLYAESLDDIERSRIAMENRIRALSEKGQGCLPDFEIIKEKLDVSEKEAIKGLQRAMRRHPLGPWVKDTVGVGEKQAARLLAIIDDPGSRDSVSQLWAYCGFHVVNGEAPKRRKGVQGNWNEKARMRARLIAESCIKQRHSPYRAIYDEARAQYADLETTDLHKHNRALRKVAKAILRDMWIESKNLT